MRISIFLREQRTVALAGEIFAPRIFKMILHIRGRILVTFAILAFSAQLVFPLKISEDTLKTVNHNKVYATGCADFQKRSQHFSQLSLARATGTIALARLEYEMHSVTLKIICSSGSRSAQDEFTQRYMLGQPMESQLFLSCMPI